jgi:hypothetical protein
LACSAQGRQRSAPDLELFTAIVQSALAALGELRLSNFNLLIAS